MVKKTRIIYKGDFLQKFIESFLRQKCVIEERKNENEKGE